MNMFLIGMTAGIAIFSAVTIIVLLFRLTTEIAAVRVSLNLIWVKLARIEKMSASTMGAAENFVDALRRSAEDMMGGPTRPDDLRDLRQTFEDGIRDLEEDSDDEGPEQWKK